MDPPRNLVLVVAAMAWLQVLGMALFLHGFFPSKHFKGQGAQRPEDEAPGTRPQQQGQLLPRFLGKTVIVVIDALRADFVFDPVSLAPLGMGGQLREEARIGYLADLLSSGQAIGLVTQVSSPTVTLPRIKALTTGSLPGFVDVILNFGSPALTQENLVSSWKRAGRGLHFYGDDTWLKLFPDHFDRSDGTTSFFVSDYLEVDDNVTRHLRDEEELLLFRQGSWDVCILHYLGLDHIGHFDGPNSRLISGKLAEMGQVIRTVVDALSSATPDDDDLLAPLILVLGDHGMANAGGHGGASLPETLTPLVAIYPTLREVVPPGRPRNTSAGAVRVAKQHDIAPTLALLTGVPIPEDNIGVFISEIVEPVVRRAGGAARRGLWSRTVHQLAANLKRSLPHEGEGYEEFLSRMDQGELTTVQEMELTARKMSDSLEGVAAQYLLVQIFAGMSAILLTLLILLLWCPMMGLSPLVKPPGFPEALAGLRIASLASSSFIEEEHQSVYFFCSSLIILATVIRSRSGGPPPLRRRPPPDPGQIKINYLGTGFAMLLAVRIARHLNQTGDKWSHLPDYSDYLSLPETRPLATGLHILSVSLLFLASVLDCGRIFAASPARKFGWTCLLLVAYLLVVAQKDLEGHLSLNLAANLLNLKHKSHYFHPAHLVRLISALLGIDCLVAAALATSSSVPWPAGFTFRTLAKALLPVLVMLANHNNACLLLLAVLMEEALYSLVKVDHGVQTMATFYAFFGLCTHFQLGNSNSLASVDVGAAFTGIDSFQPGPVGIQMALATFTGPLLWLLMLLHRSSGHQWDVLAALTFYRGLELLFTAVVSFVNRHHIMVWTVFSPKLLYEGMTSVVFALVTTVAAGIQLLLLLVP